MKTILSFLLFLIVGCPMPKTNMMVTNATDVNLTLRFEHENSELEHELPIEKYSTVKFWQPEFPVTDAGFLDPAHGPWETPNYVFFPGYRFVVNFADGKVIEKNWSDFAWVSRWGHLRAPRVIYGGEFTFIITHEDMVWLHQYDVRNREIRPAHERVDLLQDL